MKAFELDDKPKSIDDLLDDDFDFIQSNKKIHYLNAPCAFDIETTSFYDDTKQKAACMYAWVFGINGRIMVGRTWDEFHKALNKCSEKMSINLENRMIIYVHNLSFEFQFIKDRFKWDKVFALTERQVVYAVTVDGFEFRCSYILTGYKLQNLGEQCIKYPIKKMVGDLDYRKLRHSKTPLYPKEWKYIYNDGLVVMSYIQQQIELEQNNITNIPLTKTGYVRRYVKNYCLYDGKHSKNTGKYHKYMRAMRPLKIGSTAEYLQNKRAFIGGHSHGNSLAIGYVHKDVTSMDFTSSYPAVMLSEKFPMTAAKKIKITSKEQFYNMINLYCCIFDITFNNIESITPFEHWIPGSRCINKVNPIADNGKIVSADSITMSLTEVDFKTISKFYKWDSMNISNFRYYMKGYLPKDLILAVLKLYKDKTELKGVEDKYIDYMLSKGNLNSCYGMMVTDICRDEIGYNQDTHEWTKQAPDFDTVLKKYNESKNRTLFYTWGLYVTAYAKANLASGILELQYDYLYSDTDSVKFLNYDKHKKYFDEYNANIRAKLLKMINTYHLNPALIEPKTIKGVPKLIGVWDYDGHYKEFKYLGSKRYMYRLDSGKYGFTVAGCNKKLAVPYLARQVRLINNRNKRQNNPKRITMMDLFTDEMYIPSEYTSKLLHTYVDGVQKGVLKDYLGKECEYYELSSTHLEPIDFTLSMAKNFVDYLLGLRGIL